METDDKDQVRISRDHQPTREEDRQFRADSLVGPESVAAVVLAVFRSGFDPRLPEDMRRLSDHLRALELGRVEHDVRTAKLTAGMWSIVLGVIGFAVMGLISTVLSPTWAWLRGMGK